VRSRRISSTNATGPSVPPTGNVLYANELCSVVHLSTPGCRNLLTRVDLATLVYVWNRVSSIYEHLYAHLCVHERVYTVRIARCILPAHRPRPHHTRAMTSRPGAVWRG